MPGFCNFSDITNCPHFFPSTLQSAQIFFSRHYKVPTFFFLPTLQSAPTFFPDITNCPVSRGTLSCRHGSSTGHCLVHVQLSRRRPREKQVVRGSIANDRHPHQFKTITCTPPMSQLNTCVSTGTATEVPGIPHDRTHRAAHRGQGHHMVAVEEGAAVQ